MPIPPAKMRYGWIPDKDRLPIIRESVDLILSEMPKFFIAGQKAGSQGERAVLWDYTKMVNGGKHLPTYQQEVGDCFAKGTMVHGLIDKKIEDIKVGDKIFTGKGTLTKVISTRSIRPKDNMVAVQIKGMNNLACTKDHRFLTFNTRGWTHPNSDIYINDEDITWTEAEYLCRDKHLCLLSLSQDDERLNIHPVETVMEFDYSKGVYDIGVDDPHHSFIANGVIAHNCVSHGAANAVNYLACMEIVRQGDNEQFKPVFQPYIYGISRVQIGKGRLRGGDGSIGSWAADGVRRYGVLASDTPGCPGYSGKVARKWGRRPGPPKEFIKIAKDRLVNSTALVTSYNEVRDALFNGYPVTVASNQGFRMTTREDKGKAWGIPKGTWNHQMSFIGVDDSSRRPGIYTLNSWGDTAHGKPVDDAPPGGFWVDADVVDKMVRQRDSFAFSQFDGFPEQELNFSGIS